MLNRDINMKQTNRQTKYSVSITKYFPTLCVLTYIPMIAFGIILKSDHGLIMALCMLKKQNILETLP